MTQDDRISQVIFDYAARIGGAQDPEALLHLNAAMARDLTGADRCSLWLIDPKSGELWTKVAHGVPELRILPGTGIVGASITSGETILVNDTSQDPRFLQRVDQKSGYQTHSMLVLPMRNAAGAVIGALQALNKPEGFTADDVKLLNLAVSYSASAIETQQLRQEAEETKLLHKELAIARQVQNQLFPQNPPTFPGLDYAAFCRPARFVGGDYYDFTALPDGTLFFTLGDVSGKGVAAAVLMASIQAALRTQVVERPASLSALINHFNKAVYSFSNGVKYSTLFVGILDVANRTLTYVNAGQAPPLLVRAANYSIEHLTEGGMPVGLMPAGRYTQAVVALEPGDLIFAYSDGISEATNIREEIWEEADFESLLAACSTGSAQHSIDTIVKGADDFTGEADQADDTTIVALKLA
ncbi:MAG: SpoIIE family protein phosphatase [Bryobacterales bacterium]|nr:SpoIIE family protein phosphatase [Bryobacterales bacterium]